MRRSMLINVADPNSSESTRGAEPVENDRLHVNPIIVADVHKVLLLLMTALEQRQALMAKDLVALFDKVCTRTCFYTTVSYQADKFINDREMPTMIVFYL